MEKPEHKPTSQLPEGGNEGHRLPEEFKVNFDLPPWWGNLPQGTYEIDRNGDLISVVDSSFDASVIAGVTQEMRAWIKDQNVRILSQIEAKFPGLKKSHNSNFMFAFYDESFAGTFHFYYDNFIDGVQGTGTDGLMEIKVPFGGNIIG